MMYHPSRSHIDSCICCYFLAATLLLLLLLLMSQQPCSGQLSLPATTDKSTTGNNTTPQTITPLLNDKIDLSLNVTPTKVIFDTIYVPANAPIRISVIHMDPKYNQSELVYNWTTQEGQLKSLGKHDFAILHKFIKSDEDNYIRVSVFDPKTNATGEARLDFTLKSPLVVSDPVGKLFLEKGELLDINLVYSGSAPFKYCYKFCTQHDIIPCNFCFPFYETDQTKIPIVHYLHYVGNYTLTFQIENIMNYEERHYTIKINDTARKSNLPIAPIVSSILAVCILISGVALHKRFKDTSYNTETANFDFLRDDEEEWERELSFIQRVRYLFYGSEPEDNEETRYLIQKWPHITTTTPTNSSANGANGLNGYTTI